MRRPIALTVAGSDPSGGAGIQADLRAFAAAGAWGASVVTMLTVQGTRGVRRVRPVSPRVVLEQLDAVLEDLRVGAVKTGALWSAAVVRVLASRFPHGRAPLVVDPVLRSTSGATLLDERGVRALRDLLVPLADVVLPNAAEAAVLSGLRVRDLDEALRAAERIRELGARAVLVKGGHLRGARAGDLWLDAQGAMRLTAPRRRGVRLHGAGCSLSASTAAHLACGRTPRAAARAAHRWVADAIRRARPVGPGLVPLAT